MNSLIFLVRVAAGVAAIMSTANFIFLMKIKSLKKSHLIKDIKLSDLENELIKTRDGFVKTQSEFNDFKVSEAKTTTELPKLQADLEKATQECARLTKENEDIQRMASRRQNELQEALVLYSGLQDTLIEKKHQIQKLDDINQTMTSKIEALEADLNELRREKQANAEAIVCQQQELKQEKTRCRELSDVLKELQDGKQGMSIKIEELQTYLKELKAEDEGRQEIISQQRKELELVLTQLTGLQGKLKEREQYIQKLEDADQMTITKIEALEADLNELRREKQANTEAVVRQQQELEQAITLRTEFKDQVKEREQDLLRFQNINRAMAARIQELESSSAEFSREKKANEKTIARQQQEIDQISNQRSELKKALREKEQYIQKLEDANQNMPTKIQELERDIAELRQKKQSSAEIIVQQKQELEEIKTGYLQLQDTLKEKEQYIQKLKEVNQAMGAKFTETQSLIQGLEKEMQAKSAIFNEIKKESEAKKIRETVPEPISVERNESEEARENKERRLKEVLTKNKLITEEALRNALELQEKYKGNLLRFLFVNTDINEKQLVERISAEFKVPYLPLSMYEIPEEIIKTLPTALAEEYWVLPIDKIENNLMLAMVDPFDNLAIKDIEKVTGCQVKVYIGLFSEIAEKIQRFYKVNIRGLDSEGNSVCPLCVKTPAYKGRERRKAVRFKSRLPVRIADDNQVTLSTTEDISWDGLSFKLNRELPISSMITIQLSLPESKNKQENRLIVPALAQVRRATPLEDKTFMIGVQLLKVPQDDLCIIIKHISENQNNTVSPDSNKSNMYQEMLDRLKNNSISALQ